MAQGRPVQTSIAIGEDHQVGEQCVLGAPTEHETKDDPAHMTDVAVHIGCFVGAYLLRGNWHPLAFHVHLHGLVANSDVRIIDRLAILSIAAGDPVPRDPP